MQYGFDANQLLLILFIACPKDPLPTKQQNCEIRLCMQQTSLARQSINLTLKGYISQYFNLIKPIMCALNFSCCSKSIDGHILQLSLFSFITM